MVKIAIIDEKAPTTLSKRIYDTLKRNKFDVELLVNIIKKKKGLINTVLRYSSYLLLTLRRINNVLHVINTPYLPYTTALCGQNIVLHYTDEVVLKMRRSSRKIVRAASNIVSSIEDFFLRKSIAIITPNYYLRDYLAKFKGVRKSKIITIPNLPTKDFKPKNIIKIRKRRPIVIFVGTLREIFDWDLIIESAKKLEDKVDFWILGTGEYFEYLKRRAPSNVKLFGWVDYRFVPDYIQYADAAIVPLKEGHAMFGDHFSVMKVAEYAALRIPIIATGLRPSKQYLLVKGNIWDFVDGILKAIRGEVRKPKPFFWEDISERKLVTLYRTILSHLVD